MPVFRQRKLPLLLTLLLALGATNSHALTPVAPPAPEPAVENSDMDAPLFYQLIVGELELRTGQAGVAYQVLLDAARRTQDEELFKRVVNIALQARAGDQALRAARDWSESIPTSLPARQMTIQLLALLNRPGDVTEPLGELLRLTPAGQRGSVLMSLPRLFQRSADARRVYSALEPVLKEAARSAETRPTALSVQARLAMAAGDNATALALTRELLLTSPDLDDAMQLALDLMPSQPEAEALITARLQTDKDNSALRLAYGRALARANRPADAAKEFRGVTQTAPDLAPAWFALGAMELDLKQPAAAEAALNEYLKRLPTEPPAGSDASTLVEARQQAWLMLAQAAEQRGDLKAADAWLVKVDSPQRSAETQYRRAGLLARQGKLKQARELLAVKAGDSDAIARTKLLAEAQLLRDAQQWKPAYEVLSAATKRFPEDADIIYEQSMMAEKLGALDEMEALLRKVIALKPDYHNAYNALGYSLADRKVRLAEARELIVKALSYAPNEAFIIDSMAWVEYRMGNLPEALRLLRQAYASRQDTEIAAHLGEVLWVSGQQDEARKVWAEGLQREPGNEAMKETLNRLKAKP